MLDQDTIAQQLALLAQYRRTLAHLMEQAAQYGGEVFAPPQTANGIAEARKEIRRIKVVLREGGVVVEDEPNDEQHNYYQPPVAPFDREQQRKRRAILEKRRAILEKRRALLEKVRTIWIKGLLENTLAEVVKIDLGSADELEAVDLPLNLQYQELNHTPRLLPTGTPLIEVFTQAGGALLVLGNPGAGKTTMLLKLACDLIACAEQEDGHPIPIVLNLSSWAEKRRPLDDWLVEELNRMYDVPREIAQGWVDVDAVLPLLDGLDEVVAKYRAGCVKAINAYRQEHNLSRLAVCSRLADYEALTTKLLLTNTVVIQPLTQQQVDDYFVRAGAVLAGMRSTLHENASLRKLLDTPLMLNILVLVYKNGHLTDFQDGKTSYEQQYLFDAYIETMFQRRSIQAEYTQQQTITWLSQIAVKMVQYDQTDYNIERMQRCWLPIEQQREYARVFRFSSGLIGGSFIALVGALLSGLSGRSDDGMGIALGLVFGFFVALSGDDLDVSIVSKVSNKNIRRVVLSAILFK